MRFLNNPDGNNPTANLFYFITNTIRLPYISFCSPKKILSFSLSPSQSTDKGVKTTTRSVRMLQYTHQCAHVTCFQSRYAILSMIQRNLPPESPATMESVEGRSNKSALDTRRPSPSPSPIALSAQPDHVPHDLSNQRSCAADPLLSLRPDFHRATTQANTATHHMLFLESCLEGSLVPIVAYSLG